jgi:hypothetical protein
LAAEKLTAAVFRTSQKTHHATPLPAGADRAIAVEILHDHHTMMHFGPHIKEAVPLDQDPVLPQAKVFRVTDILDMLPKSLWSSDVVSTYYYTNTADGVDMVIKSPLDVQMETHWTVKDEGDVGLVLDEEVVINCSRLLVSTVLGQCDGNYKTIHGRFLERLKELMAQKAEAAPAS